MMALYADISAHANELGGEHEPVLENVLRDNGAALGKGGENHGLCLHVGREAGERQRLDINRTDAPGAMHADALIGALDVDTHKLELLEDHTEMGGAETRHLDALGTGGKRAGDDKCTGLDAVPDHAMRDGVQLVDSLDLDHGRSGARDARAHLVQHVGEVHDLGLAGGVIDNGGPLRADGCHDEILRRADARELERHRGTRKALRSRSVNVSVIRVEFDTESLKAEDMHIDLAGTEVAAAGHGDLRTAETPEQRAHDRGARAHLGDELVRRLP